MVRLKILTLFLSIGVWLLGWTYFIAYNGSFYNSIFWASVITIGLAIFLIIIDKDISEKYKIVCLFVFGAIIYILNVLPSTIHFHFNDELVTFETTKQLYENYRLNNITTHFDLPKYYPGLSLLAVNLKHVTNLDFFAVTRILIGLVHSFVPVFLYMFLKKVSFSGRIASIGTFIYATNPLYVYFHSQYSYESLGIFFGIFFLYVVAKKSFGENSVAYPIIIMVILAALTITHHLSSLMIFLFIILLAFAVRYSEKGENYQRSFYRSFHDNITALTFTFIFTWMTYMAVMAAGYLYNHFTEYYKKIFELSLFGGSKIGITSASLDTAGLPKYEWVIDSRIYAPLLVFLSIMGIIIRKYENGNKNKNGKLVGPNPYLNTMIIYGPILYILSLGFILTSGQELALRSWGFLYIGLSLMCAMTIDKLLDWNRSDDWRLANFLMLNARYTIQVAKFSAVIMIMLILIGGISTGDKPIHRVPDLLSPKVLGSGSMTTDVFRSADWFEYNFGRHNNMLGDATTSSVFTYYATQNADIQNSWQIFFPPIMNNNISNFIKYYKIGYTIVDNRITKSIVEGGFYGYVEQSEYYDKGYGSKTPLPNMNIEKFEYSKNMVNIYNNGNINIYMIIGI